MIKEGGIDSIGAIAFEEYQLDNGLKVLLHHDPKAPLVHVLVWYHVGSKDEPSDRTGFAHLFEHMMFQGSENVGKTEHFSYVQGIGGLTNASTSQDRTNYYQTLPSEYLGLGLWLEADRMRSLNVSAENFDNQRAVVREERKQRYDNPPYGLWYLTMLEMLFDGSPYQWGPIGDMAHLDAAPLESVRDFHRQFYVPNNATLIVSGDFESDEARRMIDEQFGDIPAGPEIHRSRFSSAPLDRQIRRTIRSRVPLPAVFVAFRGVGFGHPDEPALNLLATILGGGASSRLWRTAVRDRQLALDIHATHHSQESAGIFLIRAGGIQGEPIESLEEVIWEEIGRLRHEGIERRELESAFHRAESGMARLMLNLSSVSDMLAKFQVLRGEPWRVNNILDELTAVTPESALRVADTYLRSEAAAVLQYLPEE